MFLPEGLGQNSILPCSSFRGCLHSLACGSTSLHPSLCHHIFFNSLSPSYKELFTKIFIFIYSFGCTRYLLRHMGSLIVAFELFSCCTWDLVSWPGIEPRLPCIGNVESWPLDHQGNPRTFVITLGPPQQFCNISPPQDHICKVLLSMCGNPFTGFGIYQDLHIFGGSLFC